MNYSFIPVIIITAYSACGASDISIFTFFTFREMTFYTEMALQSRADFNLQHVVKWNAFIGMAFSFSFFSSFLFYSNALHCGASNWSAFIVFQTNIIQRRQTFYSQWILYYLLNLSLSYSLVLLRIICCFVQTRFLFEGIGFPLVWPLYSVEMYFLIVLHSNDKSLTDVKSSFCVFLTRAHKIEIYWKREEKKTFSEQRTEKFHTSSFCQQLYLLFL